RRAGRVSLVPLYRSDCADEMRFLDELLLRLGGTSFRLDGRSRCVLRAGSILVHHAGFVARQVVPYLWRLARRTRTLRARYFCIVSHHFMSAAETATPVGRERLSACAFRVPIDGRLEPMCAVNALGLRDSFYRAVTAAGQAA